MNPRRPGEGRYAQLEREQRWTVRALPSSADFVAAIVDRYIIGTRLRLRRVEAGKDVVFKLAQKVRAVEADPEMVRLTNMCLSAEEWSVVAALPAMELSKSRWRVALDGRQVSIDEFHGRLRGLLMAEVELGIDDPRVPMPAFATRDVTNDDRFAGGALAFASDEDIDALLGREAAGRHGSSIDFDSDRS